MEIQQNIRKKSRGAKRFDKTVLNIEEVRESGGIV